MDRLNRLINPPSANSRAMRAYMQAILETTGLMAGQEFPLELFMSNYRTHLQPKMHFPHATLSRNSEALYALTPEGVTFFSSRLTPQPIVSGQKVSRSEVLEMVREIVAPEPSEGWQAFEVESAENV